MTWADDPATFAAAGVSVIAVAGLACVVPARRAAASIRSSC